MTRNNRGKATDILFEGVVIPKGTRSAKIARKGITDVEEMGEFLTAVFSDTLKGKIILPKSHASLRVSSKMLNGLEQKLRHGIPVKVQAKDAALTSKPKIKRSKRRTREES